MLALTPPPHLLGGTLFDIRLAFEVIAAAFAVRAYRHHPTRPLRLLRCGFLCLAVTHVALLVLTGLAAFAFPQLDRFRWIYYADPIAVITFLTLSILSFQSVLSERTANGATNV